MDAPFRIKLINKLEVAEGTISFYFEKPSGFNFTAGQYLNLRLIDPPETDEEGTRRFFSIAAAPFEQDLMIATRIRDTAFKRIIKNLEIGSEVEMTGPYGSLILHQDPSIPAVFLVGGIGVTPFRSIILQATKESLAHKIYLFYSNRRVEDAPFFEEIENIQSQNLTFKLIATMTEAEKSSRPWTGETGYIRKEMVAKYIKDLSKPIYYSAGPPQMVEAMQKLAQEMGVSEQQIKTESFTGY